MTPGEVRSRRARLANEPLLAKLTDWWYTARDMQADNRREQQTDADYYDHLQYTQEEIQAMRERGQAPLVFNLCKLAVDWLHGTETRSRWDWAIRPRTPNDEATVKAKQAYIKYLDDLNYARWARSQAFLDSLKVGVGWNEVSASADPDTPPVMIEHERWRNVWWDPYSRQPLLKDCRYLIRKRTLDVEFAVAMFPQHEQMIYQSASVEGRLGFAGFDVYDIDDDLPQLWLDTDSSGRTRSRGLGGIGPYGMQQRVTILQTEYRQPVRAKRMTARAAELQALNGEVFDPSKPEHAAALKDGAVSIADSVRQEMKYAIWLPEGVLREGTMPYRHRRFSLTPTWAYRRDRDGMPYGVIRGARDAQSDYNKRLSKAQWHLATNQVIADEDAMTPEGWEDVRTEAARPDGIIRLNSAKTGAGSKRFELRTGETAAQSQVAMAQLAADHVHNGTGVNREQMGRDSNATSGRAIQAKQNEGALTTAPLFDAYRMFFQATGQLVLSVAEQYVTAPQQFRVTEDPASNQVAWVQINTPVLNQETGQWEYQNDITAQAADYIVDAQDFRETMRLAMAEQLMETIGQLPPEVGLQLLDLAIDMTDLPGKSAFVKRIRAINGQPDPNAAPDDPEVAAQRAAAAQQQQQDREMQQAAQTAELEKSRAQAAKLRADATEKNVAVQGKAMEIAQLIASLLPLAQTADQVIRNAGES